MRSTSAGLRFLVVYDFVMSVLEIPVEAAGRSMALGRQTGMRTILNPAPAVKLPAEVLRHVDFLTQNETGLRILVGLPPDESSPTEALAHRLHQYGVGTLVVTRGEQGVPVVMDDEVVAVRGIKVNVVDTAGPVMPLTPAWR